RESVGTSNLTISASWAGDGISAAVSTSEQFSLSGQVNDLSVALCSDGPVSVNQGSAYGPCSVTVQGPTGFSRGNRSIVIRAMRGTTEAWTDTVVTSNQGTASFTVPASIVGTTGFQITATWDMPGSSPDRKSVVEGERGGRS